MSEFRGRTLVNVEHLQLSLELKAHLRTDTVTSIEYVHVPHATLDYSVILPFFNESSAAPALIKEVRAVLEHLGGSAECLCIDDGSDDGTAFILEQIARTSGTPVRVIRFPTNRGQAAALYRGLLEARGRILITMDGDGQNDPSDIPILLERLEQADLVCGIRAERNDSTLRRWMSRLANRVRGRLLGDRMQDSGCALKVMRREVVTALVPIRTLYSFIPALAVAAGFRVAEVSVRHRRRNGGTSSYGLRAFAVMPFVDMIGLMWFRKRCILSRADCMRDSMASTGKAG